MYDIFSDTKIVGNYHQNVHIEPKYETNILFKKQSFVYSKGKVKISKQNKEEICSCFCSANS